MKACMIACSVAAVAVAQDPAQGWMGYAKAVSPSGGILTSVEATWINGGVPSNGGGAFYSPWIGIEASDNLNLIQTVNPWLGNGWQIYNEYFQWSPTNNYNSPSLNSNPGDVLYGRMTYNAGNHSYTMVHSDLTTGQSVTSVIDIQKHAGGFKNYTIVYVVYEKSWNCDAYPPEGQVTFSNISIAWDNKPLKPVWTTGIVDDTCNNRAHILDDATVQITWNTQ